MDIRKEKTKEDYDIIAHVYNEDFGSDTEHFEFIDRILNLLKVRALLDKYIIDLGSGPGNVIDYLLKHQITRIKAVEFTSAFVKLLQKKYADQKNIEIVAKDMTEYLNELDANTVGAYIANYSLIHIPDEEFGRVLTNIYRTLMKGGLLLMSCHKGTYKGMEVDPYQTQNDPRLKTSQLVESYMNYFTEDELRRRLSQAGLKVLGMKTFKPTSTSGDYPSDKIFLIAEKSKERKLVSYHL